MKKIGIRFLIFVLVVCFSIPYISVSATEEAVTINITSETNPKQGETMVLRLTANAVKSLAGLEFSLEFDSEFVSPIVTANSEDGLEMNSIITEMPSGWEQMCYYSPAEEKYYFRFAMPEGGNAVTAGGKIVLDVPFAVKSPGVFSFNSPSADVIAVGADESFSLLSGTGCEYSAVAAGQAEKFAIELGESDTAPENGVYYLDIEATNLGDSEGIIAVEFDIGFDKNVFKPYITQNDNYQMDAFMVSMPKNSWEQMCSYYEDESRLVLRFAALHAESLTESEKLLQGETMKLSVPFLVVGAEGDSAKFNVTSASAIGLNNINGKIVGRGDIKTVSVTHGSSLIPEWLYTVKDGHVMYIAEKTEIGEFLKPLNGLYLTNNGERVDSGFVCTGYTVTDGKAFSATVVVKGDVNCNGEIDSIDYILIKRAYYGTFKKTKTQLYAMTVTGGSDVGMMDYVLIKRHYFGTFNVNA